MPHPLHKLKALSEQAITACFGHQDYLRFVILGHARTGSNYLLEALNRSLHVKVYHEIFGQHTREFGKDFDRTIAKLYCKAPPFCRALGFKLFYYHLTDEEWATFLRHEDFRIIHLTRENRLRTIVSLDIAQKTDQWSTTSDTKATTHKSIWLNPANILARIENIQRNENLARTRFRQRPVLEITYEKMTQCPDEVFGKIADFLRVGSISSCKIRKP
jgi:LPS sulfotransferase NodH